MKRILNLFLAVVFTIHTPVAFAGEDGGGDSGGGSSSDTTYSDSSNDTWSADASPNSRDSDESDNTTPNEVVSSAVTSPAWEQELTDPAQNPILSALRGKPATDITEESLSQNFGALLLANPVALFLDLNGNGVRGDLWDGLLFNLFWGGYSDGAYTTSTFQNGVQSRFRLTKEMQDQAVMRSNLSERNVLLAAEMSDGRRHASLADLLTLLQDNRKGVNVEDRKIALSTLTLIALANPLATSDNGPFVTGASNKTKEIATNIRNDLNAMLVSVPFHSGGNQLALTSSVARLAVIAAMIESFQVQHKFSPGLSESTITALRAALYFMAFEIKRLNVTPRGRNLIFRALIQTLAQNAPRTMELAAKYATTPEALEGLKEVVRNLPVINSPLNHRKGLRIGVSVVTFGVVMLAWMNGAVPSILKATHNSLVGVAGSALGTIAVSSAAAVLVSWLLKPRRVGVLDPGVKAFYETIICEEELVR